MANKYHDQFRGRSQACQAFSPRHANPIGVSGCDVEEGSLGREVDLSCTLDEAKVWKMDAADRTGQTAIASSPHQ